MKNYNEERPWGTFENLLDCDYCKVKRIVIKPGGAPSYQYHHKRNEVWTVVQGSGQVILNDEVIEVTVGSTILVPVGDKHRPINNSSNDMIFIEVQWGEYFGEDDIVRLEDNYGRV
jgi:mannose-6-phosphate isomerase-like protein (cupin superfamily)|tara:strand:- start:131 stop:478 length:348 start_codon:yes stop_codon:yes gene_type:complete